VILFLLQAFYSSIIAFVLASMFNGIGSGVAFLSLAFGLLFAIKHSRLLRAQDPGFNLKGFSVGQNGTLEALILVFTMYVGWRHFLYLFFENSHAWKTLNPDNYGDLPLHISYIRVMASGISFPPLNPGFASEILRYPFGGDLYNALWEAIGVPLRAHLFVTGMLCTLANLLVLRWFGGWWAMGAFFLSGGWLGWDVLAGAKPLYDIQGAMDWKNLMLSVFITQRGVMFALPLALILLEVVRREFSGEIKLTRPAKTILGLIWAILPLFHAHFFVIVSLMMGAFAINGRGWRGLRELLRSRMAMIAYLPSVFFILRTSAGFKKAGITHWDWWWTGETATAPTFMWNNFGFWLLLPVAVALGLWFSGERFSKEERRKLWGELLISLAFFALFFNLMLAPWNWDNIKLLIWPYLFIVRLAWVVVDPVLGRWLRFPTAIALFFSGFLMIAYSLREPSVAALTLYPVQELAEAEAAIEKIPADSVFLAAPTHDHMLTYFGRLRIIGHGGHLWSHAIDYQGPWDKNENVMFGRAGWQEQAKELGANYIYWGPQERARYGVERKPWMDSLLNVSRINEIAIYKLP
jgi:hypothetical protein